MYRELIRGSQEVFEGRVKSKLCVVLGQSRSGYYQGQNREKELAMRREHVIVEVKEIRKRQPCVGGRKLKRMLSMRVGRDWLFGVLRGEGLLVRRRRNAVRTTCSRHPFKRDGNRIREREPSRSGEQWVSDITYVDLEVGPAYLSLITDRDARKIVGHYLSRDLMNTGPIRALDKALEKHRVSKNWIHHSDQGSQYCSWDYVRKVEEQRGHMSMTEGAHVHQNALAERVNGILKEELGLASRFSSFEEARKGVEESIEIYNHERLHLALHYKTPGEVHQQNCPLF